MEITYEMLDFLASVVPGHMGIYRVSNDAMEALYNSPDLHELNGMTSDEYEALTARDATALVVEDDLPGVVNAMRDCVLTGNSQDMYYRVVHKTRGFDWAHARARLCGELDGAPVLLVVYANASVEADIYQNIIDRSASMAYVVDRHTHQLLYANRLARESCSSLSDGILGKTCYKSIRGCDAPCDDCMFNEAAPDTMASVERYNAASNTWMRTTGGSLMWCGHDAFLQFVDDVTEVRQRQFELQNILDREEGLLRSIQALNGSGSLDERMGAVLAETGERLDADRAYIFKVEGDKTSNRYEWCRKGIAPEIGSLQNVDISYMQRWLPAFEAGRGIIVTDIEDIRDEKPDEYAIMGAQGIHSYVEAPIIVDGMVDGFLGVDNPAAEKVAHAQDLLLSLAYSVANTVVKARDEYELRESERRYELAVAGAGMEVWQYDIAGHRMINANRSYAAYNVPEVVEDMPNAVLPLVVETDRAKLLDMYRKVEAGESPVTADYWMRWAPDLPLRCERVTYTVIKDEQGKPVRAYGLGMDVTAIHTMEEGYERTLRQLLTLNPNALCTYQLNLTANRCDAVSNTGCYASGLASITTVDGLVEAAAEHLVDPAERERFVSEMSRSNLLERYAHGESDISLTYRRRMGDGKTHWVTARNSIMTNPVTLDIMDAVSVVDDDDRVTNEEIFSMVTSGDYDHISIISPLDSTVRLKYCSPEGPTGLDDAQLADGADYEALCDVVAASLISPADSARFRECVALGTIVRQLGTEGEYSFETDVLDGHGGLRRKQVRYSYLDGTHERIVETQRDITSIYQQQRIRQAELAAQVKREQALRDEAQQASQLKTEFLSNVSHDMRTPLNGVLGYTNMARKTDDPAEMRGYLDKIEQSAKVLQQLIDDTLDLNKISTGSIVFHAAPVAAYDIFNDLATAIMPTLAAKGVAFVSDFDGCPMEAIDADVVRIRQVFLNLLANAAKFTPEGGTITVKAVRLSREGDIAHDCITLSDTGCGMDPEFIPRMFEPFSQEYHDGMTGNEGSGLGLSIVKGLVERMGGHIEVESELGLGTTFRVFLDFKLVPADALEKPASKKHPAHILAGRRVLLVEDNAMNTEIALMMLESDGAKVECATNGKEAVEAFGASPKGYFDLVLMDVRMPVMDGLEATRAIRALGHPDAATIPIIAMTANAYDSDVADCLAAGMDAHVAKPIDPDAFFAALDASFGMGADAASRGR